jgi:outer membrane protein TolC
MDVSRARSVAAARRADVFRSRERVRVVTEQLKYLLNGPDLAIDADIEIIPTEIPRTAPVEISVAEALENGLKHRAEIRKAEKTREIAEIQENLSRHQRLPKLSAYFRYGLNGHDRHLNDAFRDIDFDDRNAWSVGLEFEAPLGNRSAEAVYRKQKLVRKQAGVALKQTANQIKLEIKEAVWAIERAKDVMASTRLEMTEAARVVEGEFERFELGQMTNEELFRAQDFLGNARRNHVQAVVGYNIALAELDRAQNILPYGLRFEDAQGMEDDAVSLTQNNDRP